MTFALTNYNRTDLLIESFESIHDNPLITEIVISDDHSDIGLYQWVASKVKSFPKVKLTRNYKNMGMYTNKMLAVKKSSSDWVILADSDNKFSDEYINAIPKERSIDTIYMPSFAEPNFDFTEFEGMTFDKSLDTTNPKLMMMLNTANYVVHRDSYVKTWEQNETIRESDTIFFAYLHLKRGGKFHVVPGMRYFHRVHPDSGWLRNQDYNLKQAAEITKMIRDGNS